MKLMTPQITETAPGSGEYVLENRHALWLVRDELPADAECRECHTPASCTDERPWAKIPQGGGKPAALFCPICVDGFKK